ncbi:MAG: PAS domain-containing protein, partial [Chloroflexales bacterium]|nr:PAS domain-containing protein [Chloroflexales bacterium]
MSTPVAAEPDPTRDEPAALRARITVLEAQLAGLEQLLAHLPGIILRVDRQHRAIYVSPSVERITAQPAATLLGKTIHELGLPADLVARWADALTAAFAATGPTQISVAIPGAAGLRHYDAWLVPEVAPDGMVATVLISACEVTDRMRAEARAAAHAAKLHTNAERLDLILRHLPISFFAQDADLRYTWITNPQLGLSTEEIVGKTDAELLSAASVLPLTELKRGVLERGTGIHAEVCITWEGAEYCYDLTIEPLRDAVGAPCGVLCAALEVTERRRLEGELQRHQALLQSVFDHAPAIILVKDLAGRYLLVNRRLALSLGRAPESILGQTVAELFPPAIAAVMRANDRQVLSTNQPLEVEEPILVGGELHTQLSVLFPIVDAQGATTALGLVATDITERTRIAQALQASEVRFRAVANLVPDLLWSTDPHGVTHWFNQRWLDYTGQTMEQAIADGWLAPIHPEDRDTALRAFQQALAAGQALRQEQRLRGTAGTYRWFLVRAEPIHDVAGRIVQWYGAASEIHEQRLSLERERSARQDSERAATRIARLQAVTAALSEAPTPAQVAEVISAHARADLGASSTTVRLINPHRGTLDLVGSVGVPQELLAGWEQTPLEALTPITAVAQRGEPLFFESRRALSRDYPRIAEAVTPFGMEASAIVPLRIEGRTIGSLTLTFGTQRPFAGEDRDVITTLAGLVAQALDRARLYSTAQEAIAARDTFIAVASHDLRAPLTAILAHAQLLERQAVQAGLDAQVGRRAQQIAEQTRRLNRLINAMLDLARIQSGQLTLSLAPCDLAELVVRTVADIQLTVSHHVLIVQG